MISVVMPEYNADVYLTEAIESILEQTYSGFEFIIINDGSTDSFIKYDVDKDSRIKVISHKNKRLIASLNEGLRLAKGKYAEGYELWCRISRHGYGVSNLEEVLFRYRVNTESVSSLNSSAQEAVRRKAHWSHLSTVPGIPVDFESMVNNVRKVKLSEYLELLNFICNYVKNNRAEEVLVEDSRRFVYNEFYAEHFKVDLIPSLINSSRYFDWKRIIKIRLESL